MSRKTTRSRWRSWKASVPEGWEVWLWLAVAVLYVLFAVPELVRTDYREAIHDLFIAWVVGLCAVQMHSRRVEHGLLRVKGR